SASSGTANTKNPCSTLAKIVSALEQAGSWEDALSICLIYPEYTVDILGYSEFANYDREGKLWDDEELLVVREGEDSTKGAEVEEQKEATTTSSTTSSNSKLINGVLYNSDPAHHSRVSSFPDAARRQKEADTTHVLLALESVQLLPTSWILLKRGLSDPKTRKRAKFLVERIVDPKEFQWFWAVFDSLEEFASHWVKQNW
ncbi:unnamed protein product, partial [Amoebophrya sp. A25]